MQPAAKYRLRAGARALLGPMAFATAAGVSGRRATDYRHRDEPISALAARGSLTGPTMVAGFVGLGTGSLALARELRRRDAASAIPTLMTLAGLSTIGAGLAGVSDRSCPTRFLGDRDADLMDELHGIFSMTAFVLWMAMPLSAGRRDAPMPSGARRTSRALGIATVAGFCATGALAKRDAPKWGGLAQRLTVATALAWFPVAGAAFAAKPGPH